MRTTEKLPAHSSVYILKSLPTGSKNAIVSLNMQSSPIVKIFIMRY